MNKNSRYLTGIVAFLLCLLCSCATTPPPPPASGMSPAIYQRLLTYNQWHLNGKLGYRDENGGGSAWVDWQQNDDQFELNLRGPFGAGATQIKGAGDFAVLSQGGKDPVTASSAASLTAYLFGWSWPVEELLFWVKGIPATNKPVEMAIYNDQQLLTQLQQSGWQLQFSNYQSSPGGLILPGKIKGQFQQVSFTLLIKQWSR